MQSKEWKKAPLGIKSGKLKNWIEMMDKRFPIESRVVGNVYSIERESGKNSEIGYQWIQGKDGLAWARVSKEIANAKAYGESSGLAKSLGLEDCHSGDGRVYLGDGVWI